MSEQARILPYVHAMRFETPPLRELADRLARLTPAGLNHAYFVSGGSEAVESAIKLARQYWLERDDAQLTAPGRALSRRRGVCVFGKGGQNAHAWSAIRASSRARARRRPRIRQCTPCPPGTGRW
jgi:4-aminobutyrate aminotransferase-like enzyme